MVRNGCWPIFVWQRREYLCSAKDNRIKRVAENYVDLTVCSYIFTCEFCGTTVVWSNIAGWISNTVPTTLAWSCALFARYGEQKNVRFSVSLSISSLWNATIACFSERNSRLKDYFWMLAHCLKLCVRV
jgi:hypothetical protein